MSKQKNKQKGITLIALVVTIIVLIILAGISIAMLVGENGIITQAQRAAQETEIKGDEEKIRLAMATTQIENNGNSNIEKDDLEIELLENGTKSIVVDKEDGTRNIIFLDSKKIYKLNSDGSIEDTNSDFDSIYVAPDSQDEARNEGVIGIGTDGQPVDMDLWEYTLLNDGTYGLNDENVFIEDYVASSGYSNDNLIDGKIQGVVPQYIKEKGDAEFKAVTSLAYLFCETDLSEAPVIPSTVTNIRATFNSCENLTKMPEIPNNVTNMYGTFTNATSLTQVTSIPSSVVDMYGAFMGCVSLTVAPSMPRNGVENMQATFKDCTSLMVSPSIPDSVINMRNTFAGCTALVTGATIPSSVMVLIDTFNGCSNLQGCIEINANVTGKRLGGIHDNNIDYSNCFLEATTNSGISLKVTGTCSVLQEIVDNANNPNISLE